MLKCTGLGLFFLFCHKKYVSLGTKGKSDSDVKNCLWSQVVVAHAFNSRTKEIEAGGSL